MRDQVLLVRRHFDGSRFQDGGAAIRLSGKTIADVVLGDSPAFSDDAEVHDLRDKVVLPGLINTHVHIARAGMFSPTEPVSIPTITQNLTHALRSGTTTVADMGCPYALGAELRSIVTDDPSKGPDIRVSGPILTSPEGYPFDWMPPIFRFFGTAVPIDAPREGSLAVAKLARRGVDHIKIAVMHRSYADRPLPALSIASASAIVLEAHRHGLRVFAHAHSNDDYRVSLAARVDGLAHSTFDPLTPELVAQVRDQGVTVCPTLWAFDSVCFGCDARLNEQPGFQKGASRALRDEWASFAEAYRASSDVFPPGIAGGLTKARALEGCRMASANMQVLRDAGVPFAFGNDGNYGFSRIARPVDELLCMKKSGLSDEECLASATSGAAGYLGLRDRGTIAKGMLADFVVTDDWQGLESLAAPHAVIRHGVRVPEDVSVGLGTSLRVARGLVKSALG
jgi:imidazolonepropionase-like amidohydrolase